MPFSFSKSKFACLFPTDKNKARKNGTRISQEEKSILIIKAPETVLITNKVVMVSTSAKIIF